MPVIWAWVMLISAAPLAAPSRSDGTCKVSVPILITAICWPLALVLRLEIEPIVAPVLSLTASPTVSAGAPAVALVFAPDVLADGAFAPVGKLLEGMLEDGMLLEGMLLLEEGSELSGIEDEPVGGVAP